MICLKPLKAHCNLWQCLLARSISTFPPSVCDSKDHYQSTWNAVNDESLLSVCDILNDQSNFPVQNLCSALEKSGFKPYPDAISSLFLRFDTSPKLVCSLFDWSLTKPDFKLTPSLLNSVINALGRIRDFSRAWCIILHCLNIDNSCLVSFGTFAALIRNYSHEGFPRAANRTFQYATKLGFFGDPSSDLTLFYVLLDALCKTSQVKLASSLFDKRKSSDPLWSPTARMYNILLQGWLRVKNLEQAEKLWSEFKFKDLVSFSTMIEVYCKLGNLDKAIDLFFSMHSYSIAPNLTVFRTIIISLAEEKRMKEASGMMERLMLTDFGPDRTSFNALVKGYCKAKDLQGANKILKTMIKANIYPTTTTYNQIFKCYAKSKRVEGGMDLYSKMVESGYVPDRKTYHELISMLCENGDLGEAIRVCKEMREKGMDWDRESGSLMIHLLCSKERHEEAFHLFEEMVRIGVVLRRHTFQRLNNELRARRMIVMAKKMNKLLSTVPSTCGVLEDEEMQRVMRNSVLQKAEVLSEILKSRNFRRNPSNGGVSGVDRARVACRIIEDLKARACQLPDVS